MTVAAATSPASARRPPAADALPALTDRDDADVRALLRRRPMEGRIRVALTRDPDSRIAAAVEGERHATWIARDGGGRLLGFGTRSVRRVWLVGTPVRLGYLGQLRATEGACGLRRLAEGYDRLRAGRRADELPFDLTAILADNLPARRLLERGLPGLPRYRPLAEIETLVIPAARGRWRRGDPAVRRLAEGDRRRLSDFFRAELRHRPFAPVWSAEDFEPGGRARGLSLDDFRAVEEGGRMVAAAALWDQRAYKQAVIDGYAGWLGALRPLVNLGLGLLGRPTLPPPGSELPLAFVAALTVAGGDADRGTALIEALRREARRRGLSQIVASFAAGDPLAGAVRRRFGARPYRSILYTVAWSDDPTPPLAGDLLGPGRPLHVEAALL